ncbi:hypothetical protein OE88DRAFT_1405861 [Heliocybe sulcata]|uniref:DUF6533 domain-containing protein n=1 Tax=Heliocybe sulcata TaxID=5364 RepID=A0A5C3N4V9_9AGAM|nr:hypothetical protein OE88DRAFT_1405861 [Heliocybe sulcata]
MQIPDVSQVVEIAATSLSSGRYNVVVVYTIHLYEWLISLEEEVSLIHRARWNAIKIAYLFSRYYPLLLFPLHMWSWLGNHDHHTCDKVTRVLYCLLIPFPFSAQTIIMLRTYAFTGRRKSILAILCVAAAAILGLEVWIFGTDFTLSEELFLLYNETGCFAEDRYAQANVFVYRPAYHAAGLFLAIFFFDSICISLIVGYCFWEPNVRCRLAKTFVEQGFAAFLIMSVLNITSAAFYFISARQWNGISLPYALILPNVVACRLILTLRRTVLPTETQELRQHSHIVRNAIERLELDHIP